MKNVKRKNYTGQFDHYEFTAGADRIWLKNVIPNQLGYLKRYIDIIDPTEFIEDLIVNSWIEFEGLEINDWDDEFFYGLEIKFPRNIKTF